MIVNNHEHITDQISDYVLGQLSEQQALNVRSHIAHCSVCHRELVIERQIGAEIRNTLAAVSLPNEKQLMALMPKSPPLVIPWHQATYFRTGLAVAFGILIITLTTIGLRTGINNASWLGPSPVVVSTTTLLTNTPSQSLIATPSADIPERVITNTPVAIEDIGSPHPAIIPVPVATFLK